MSKRNNLTGIWDAYANSIIKESAPSSKAAKFGTKPGKGPVDADSKDAGKMQNADSSGPDSAETLLDPIDPKTAKKGDNLYEPEKFSDQKFNKKLEKMTKQAININMESVFDKLFEEVMDGQDMDELDALGVDTEEDGTGEEETDEVTLTLDRETAQKLHDMLMAQLGGEEEDLDGEGGDEEGGSFDAFDEDEEHEEDEDEDELEEAVEIKELPNSNGAKLQSKNNKVGGAIKASGGKANGSVKSTVDGKGKPMKDGSKKLQGKGNKVGGTKTGSTGGSLFA